MLIANNLFYSFNAGEKSWPSLVLLHGGGGTHLYWPPQIRRLPGYSIYALDLPGHGRSSWCNEESIRDYSGSVRRWMQAVNLEQAVVAGHSMGSAIALTMALESPEAILGLVLLGAGARLRVNPAILENCSIKETYPAAVQMVNDWAFGDQAPSRLVELATQRMEKTPREVLYRDFLACNEFDLTHHLEEIGQPALIIVGSEDRLTPERFARYLAERLPAAQLQILAGGGHMLMLEQPEKVADIIKAFLDRVVM